MTSIAAYYVMVAADRERPTRTVRDATVAPRTSLLARISDALVLLVSFGRPTTTHPF